MRVGISHSKHFEKVGVRTLGGVVVVFFTYMRNGGQFCLHRSRFPDKDLQIKMCVSTSASWSAQDCSGYPCTPLGEATPSVDPMEKPSFLMSQ